MKDKTIDRRLLPGDPVRFVYDSQEIPGGTKATVVSPIAHGMVEVRLDQGNQLVRVSDAALERLDR